ncbi:MAG: riboflavin biosynthesis protein RibF [Phycisphaerales bacterium]|nr:riboflavin biosynthesis protein RibF [Phycisphaerales bacterium]
MSAEQTSTSPHDTSPTGASTAVTIGNFDGVHIGHAALIRACRRAAGERGRVVVMAFDPHPATTLAPDRVPARLTTFETRTALLKSLGADEVVRLEPSRELLALTPEQFVDRVLMPLGPAVVVEGDDFHFGRGRAGTTSVLAKLGDDRGFRVHVEPAVEVDLDDQTIVRASSSLIRWLISHGRVSDARRLLNRPYAVTGEVVQGDQRGRDIGYPTANILTPVLLPGDGVYAGTVQSAFGRFDAAINVGRRPTFRGLERRMEVFAMSEAGQPAALPMKYGWHAEVSVEHWIREDLRFSSVQDLIDQIGRDVRESCRRLIRGGTPGRVPSPAYPRHSA